MLNPCLFPVAAAGSSILLAILGIAFLIFVHEFGHYLACRLTRTRVETFSIGFGPRLLGWESRPGEPRRLTVGRRRLEPADHAMDFRISIVPLGGYVKMAGENPGEERSGDPDEFPSKPMAARVFIVCAGVIMNVLTAAAFYWIAFAGGVEVTPPVAGEVVSGGPAWEAGIEPGDRFLEIGNGTTRSFEDVRKEAIFLPRDEKTTVRVERGGHAIELPLTPRYDEDSGAVQLKVAPPSTLTLKQGDRSLVVGPRDEVEIAGVPARGGAAAFSLLVDALGTAMDPVRVVKAGAPPLDLPTTATVQTPDGKEQPEFKIGIEQRADLTVEHVRGAVEAAGLRVGDVLRAAQVDGAWRPLVTRRDLEDLRFGSPPGALRVTRDGQEQDLTLPGGRSAAALLDDLALARSDALRVQPIRKGVVAPSEQDPTTLLRYPSSPAGDAGLVPGDEILAIGAKDVASWQDIRDAVHAIHDATPIEVRVKGSDGAERTLHVTPVVTPPLGAFSIEVDVAREPFQAGGVARAAGLAVARTGREIADVFRVIGALFNKNLSFNKNIAGPVTIVSASSSVVEASWLRFLLFLAYISITLAVLNILPIPVLDGGHLLFIVIEKVKGSPLTEKTMGRMQLVGMLLLLVLMFYAFRNDFRFVTK